MDAGLDRALAVLRDGEQLDGVAQLARERDVDGVDVPDALGGNAGEARAHAEGEHGEQRELVRRVDAVDVGRGIRLRQPEPLRLGQHVVEARVPRASSW